MLLSMAKGVLQMWWNSKSWVRWSWLSRWAPWNCKGPFMWKRQAGELETTWPLTQRLQGYNGWIWTWEEEGREPSNAGSSRSWNRPGNRFSPTSRRHAVFVETPMLVHWAPFQTYDHPPELWDNTSASFEATTLVVSCYSSNGKLIEMKSNLSFSLQRVWAHTLNDEDFTLQSMPFN